MLLRWAQIHLKVDTALTDRTFSIAAYQSRTLSLGERQVALEFFEVPCEVLFSAVERAGGAPSRWRLGLCGCGHTTRRAGRARQQAGPA